jgi:hypothetical protein
VPAHQALEGTGSDRVGGEPQAGSADGEPGSEVEEATVAAEEAPLEEVPAGIPVEEEPA